MIPRVGHRMARLYVPPPRRGASITSSPPLLLMFDGQNLFDDAPSFAGGWHLHEAVEKRATLRRRAVAPVVLGIDHGGLQRRRELNPFAPDSRTEPLLDWIEGKLLPVVRRLTGLELVELWVGGSSLGGLAALYAHLSRPHLYRGAMALSPALPATQGAFFRWLAQRPDPPRSRIYIDAGGQGGDRQIAAAAGELATLLRRRGWTREDLLWHFVKSGRHNERHWRRRTPKALRFLFG